MKTLVKSILVHLSNSRERTMKYMRAIDESLDTVWPIKNLYLSRTCSKASIRWWLRRKLLRERRKRTIFFFFFFFFMMYKLFQAGRGFSLNYYLYYIYKYRLHYKHAKYLRETWSRACVDWLSLTLFLLLLQRCRMPNIFVASRLCNLLRSHDRNIIYIENFDDILMR